MKLVFDLEADGWRDVATRVWCIAAKDVDTGELYQFDPDTIVKGLALLRKAEVLIGHNILNYDLPLLERLYGFKTKAAVIDTVVVSRTLRSDRDLVSGTSNGPHSIESWGIRLGRAKPEHDDWTRYTPEMLHRCTEDAEINLLVYRQLMVEKDSIRVAWDEALQLEYDVAAIMTQQEINGVPLDLEKIDSLSADFGQRISAIDVAVVPLVPEVVLPASKQATWPKQQFKKDGTPTMAALKYYGDGFTTYRTDLIVKTAPINLGSEKQVKEYLLTIGWVPTEWNYKKDARGKPIRNEYGDKVKTSPKLTEDSLVSCTWPEGHEQAGAMIVERLMLAHRLSVLTGWKRDVRLDGRLPAETIPAGTPTGRMVHRKLVNVPRNSSPYGEDLRSCCTTLPGFTRIGADFKSCQLRALCHYIVDPAFQDQVLNGDVYAYSGKQAGLETRDQGKKMILSTLFGAQPPKLSTDLGITLAQAKVAQSQFFSGITGLNDLLGKLKYEWKQKGYITGLDGRAVWVRSEHMLLVYLMQNLESTVVKRWLVEVHSRWNSDARMMQVTVNHDEGQFLVEDKAVEQFKDVAEASIAAVNERYHLTCPQAIDIKTGRTWAECH